MAYSILLLAAAAAGRAAAPHSTADAARARAEGYAQAQAALAGQDSFTPEMLAHNLATGQPNARPPSSETAPMPAMSSSGGGGGALSLTCIGGGTANKVSLTSAWGFGSFSGSVAGSYFSGSSSGSAMALGSRQQGFADQADIRLFSGDDRIRLPRTMLPIFHGGEGGWFKLKDVVADARAIRASIAVFAFHNPKLYIDRVTGTISISGKDGDYSGQCQAVAADAVARF